MSLPNAVTFRRIIKDRTITPPYDSTNDEDWVNYYLQVIALRPTGYVTCVLSPKHRAQLCALLRGRVEIVKLDVEYTRERTLYVTKCIYHDDGIASIDWSSNPPMVSGCCEGGSVSLNEAIALGMISRNGGRTEEHRRLMLKPL